MRVHLIKEKSVFVFAESVGSHYSLFSKWLSDLNEADWERPSDILKTFNSADILGKGSHRAVFNVGGNKYRIIAAYKFGSKAVRLFIKWIGTHKEYDALCRDGKQYTVGVY